MKIKKNNKLKKILSIMALLEVLVLVVAVTYSWTMDSKTQGKINGNALEVNIGGDIYATQDGKTIDSISNSTITLAECSSIDGRNFFFPLANNTSYQTASMKFREGNPADVNVNYFQTDFELMALKDKTPVYLAVDVTSDSNYAVTPIRVSINYNDGTDPVVLSNLGDSFTPISAIKNDGSVNETVSCETFTFTKYESELPLFTFSKNGDVKNITVTVWLEGTVLNNYYSGVIANKSVNANIKFFT